MLRPLAAASLSAASLAAFALVAPAGAVSGGHGVSAALHRGTVIAITRATERQQHSCQAHTSSQTSRKFAPVACEQPPKSDITGLAQTASALAVLG